MKNIIPAKQLTSRATGALMESYACDFLLKQGLKLIQRNYRCRSGEIDLIMQDKNDLVFIEIRFRSSNLFDGALASVTLAKQKKLLKTAKFYLLTHPAIAECFCRFDVVAISGDKQIEWIKDAFQA